MFKPFVLKINDFIFPWNRMVDFLLDAELAVRADATGTAERSAFSSMFLFGESRGVCFMRRAGFGVLRVMGRGSSGFPGRKENIG